jgi:hypothetical protein
MTYTNNTLQILLKVTLPTLLVAVIYVVFAVLSDAKATENETVSKTNADNVVSQFQRCQGPWHYRCSGADKSTNNDLQTSAQNQSFVVADGEPAFRRCGRLWQYRCNSESNAQKSDINFARQEYLINDQQSISDENQEYSEQVNKTDGKQRFRRCGRQWKLNCTGRRN